MTLAAGIISPCWFKPNHYSQVSQPPQDSSHQRSRLMILEVCGLYFSLWGAMFNGGVGSGGCLSPSKARADAARRAQVAVAAAAKAMTARPPTGAAAARNALGTSFPFSSRSGTSWTSLAFLDLQDQLFVSRICPTLRDAMVDSWIRTHNSWM